MKRIAVLISGSGSNLQAIMDACANGDIANGQVCAVFSNQAEAYGLQRAQAAGIPAHALPHHGYTDRLSYDRSMMAEIDAYQPDLIVLAGFMRILSEEFVNHYLGRLINIHPSLLPKYPGLHTHQRAIEAGDTEHGSTVHFVTPELDSGPLIRQTRVPIQPGDTPESLMQRVQKAEHRLYPEVVNLIINEKVSWESCAG